MDCKIEIGNFIISRCSDKSIWIERKDGDGEGAEFMLGTVEKAIEKFYTENF